MRQVLGLSVLAAVLVGASPPQIAPARLPVEVFAELPRVENPAISPDGLRYAAKLALDGKQYLAIVTVEGSKPKLINTGDVDLNWWRWVNDEWLVVGIGEEKYVQG